MDTVSALKRMFVIVLNIVKLVKMNIMDDIEYKLINASFLYI